MTFMLHLRSVDKGIFLRLNFTPKITKNSGASGVSEKKSMPPVTRIPGFAPDIYPFNCNHI